MTARYKINLSPQDREVINNLIDFAMSNQVKRKLVFIGGVHGVGKTTFCRNAIMQFPISHASASELIRNEKKENETSSKKVEDAPKNQDFLIRAINRWIDEKKWHIVDGHFCLLGLNEEIIKIPIATFVEIRPAAILVIHDDAAKICGRLNQRDENNYSTILIDEFQLQEIEYARIVAESLNVPYIFCELQEAQGKGYFFLESLLGRD